MFKSVIEYRYSNAISTTHRRMLMDIETQRLKWRIASAKYKQNNSNYKEVSKRKEEKRRSSEKRLNYMQRYLISTKGRAYTLRRAAKQRALKFNLPFNLSQEWIQNKLEQGTCELTGLAFKMVTEETYGEQNNMQPFSPSLDRIIPSKGYTEENCQVICNIANQCKMHWTLSDVDIFVKAYYERNLNVRQV